MLPHLPACLCVWFILVNMHLDRITFPVCVLYANRRRISYKNKHGAPKVRRLFAGSIEKNLISQANTRVGDVAHIVHMHLMC